MRVKEMTVNHYKQRGFSLLEVLITLVIVSVGLLGMVALQTKSVSYTQDLVNKNNAIMLTHELANIMRSRPGDVFQNSITTSIPMYTVINPNSVFIKNGNNFQASGVNIAAINCVANPQTGAEMRDCWLQKAVELLPGAENLFAANFHICRSTADGGGCTPAAGSMIEIQVAWSVPDGTCAIGSSVCTLTSRIQL